MSSLFYSMTILSANGKAVGKGVSRTTEQASSSAVSATLFAGGGVGEYIMIAIIAFALGATLMLFCVKMRK